MRAVAYRAAATALRSVGPPARIAAGLLFGLAAAAMSSLLMAQTSADSPSAAVLEEVTVTAQKRETRLEDTPVAVSAFTPDFIDRNRIQSLEDVALRTPSLAFVQINKGSLYLHPWHAREYPRCRLGRLGHDLHRRCANDRRRG